MSTPMDRIAKQFEEVSRKVDELIAALRRERSKMRVEDLVLVEVEDRMDGLRIRFEDKHGNEMTRVVKMSEGTFSDRAGDTYELEVGNG